MKGFRERRRAPARIVVVRSVVLDVAARRKVRVVRKPRPVAPASPAREGN